MKKAIVLVLACALLLGCMSTSLAVTATYNEGLITVSTGLTGFYEIWIDGVGSGYWVGTGRPTNTFSADLADGQHSVRLYSPDGDPGESNTFWVGPEPTEEPVPEVTEEPAASVQPTETETNKKEVVELGKNVAERSELNKAAVVKEPTCTEAGLDSNDAAIPALGHLFRANKSGSEYTEYLCVRCGATIRAGVYNVTNSRLGNIVTDADKKVVSYKSYALKDVPNVYYVKPDKSGELTMTLDSNVIVTLLREGYDKIAFVNGSAELRINLNNISKKWFDTSDRINNYQITTNPNAEGGTLVKICVETDSELLGATYFVNVQLNGQDIFLNGIY